MHRRDFLHAAAGAALAPAAAAQGRPPNFVVLFADDMGFGDLGCYGHPTIRTPNLDRMAAQGVRFTSCYAAAPFCTPSRVGLLTGRYPQRAGLPNNLGPNSKGGLPESEKTIANLLKDRGYRTMAIGKWHLGHDPATLLPTHRGFDHYYGLPYSNDMIRPFVQTDRPLRLYRDDQELPEHPVDQTTLTERYTEEAIKFISGSGRNPFLLYLPYAMPHLPISASRRFAGKSRGGLYGDVIETLDWSAGEILKTLAARNLDSNTLVVFASDNGPWLNLPDRMLQRGNLPWHAGQKGLLRGSKGDTYEGGIRVPAIARWPGTIPGGQTNHDTTATLDVFATIAQAAGVTLPADRTYDGLNLLPSLQGKGKHPRDHFYYFRGPVLEAIRENNWKLRLTRDQRPELKPDDPVTPELFDLDDDPAERYNRAAEKPEIAVRLTARLRGFAGELKAKVDA